MKVCTVCKQNLEYSFYHRSKNTKDGYGYRCRKCDKEARVQYREANRERFAEVARKKQLKFKYGISLEDYEEMLKKQGGCCAICGTTENGVHGTRRNWNWSVDHDHVTGKVRGLLCNNCNRGLGMLGDTEDSLEKALKYLRKTH
jgi:hypothetical protein